MGDAASIAHMNPADFLEWERNQRDKHEYHLGEVFAMAGGSARHNVLAGAAVGELRVALRGRGCHVSTSDQRIAADEGRRYVYADAVVVCGPMQMEPGTSDVLANPRVIVHVLSKSTEAYDRGVKWQAYQRLDSLTDYLLVAQGSARVEHFQREADHSWRYRELGAGDTITLSDGATVAIDAIYETAFDVSTDE